MLASTVQFSNDNQTPPRPDPTRPTPPHRATRVDQDGPARDTDSHPGPRRRWRRSVPSGPNSAPTSHHPTPDPVPHHPRKDAGRTRAGSRAGRPELVSVPPSSTTRRHRSHPEQATVLRQARHHHRRGGAGQVLLRKEVIQPHLPVRLPCYDFVPIASPTFDGSLPQGVRPPASGVTDFRDVTGGVYKARERIHRSVADLRLLATPTSWGRVADPNPN